MFRENCTNVSLGEIQSIDTEILVDYTKVGYLDDNSGLGGERGLALRCHTTQGSGPGVFYRGDGQARIVTVPIRSRYFCWSNFSELP